MIIDLKLLKVIEKNVKPVEVYDWILMEAKQGEEKPVDFSDVVELLPSHADKLYDLYRLWPAGSRSKAYLESWIRHPS